MTKRRKRRLPRLDAEVLRNHDALSEALDQLLRRDRQLQRHHRDILRRSRAVRRLVDDHTWRAMLELEEVQIARFSDALDLVAKWAFSAGLLIGRRQR